MINKKKEETPSVKSPKNRYHVEIYFRPAIKELGSVVSLGAMTIEDARALGIQEAKRILLNSPECKADILIKENRAIYPKFDWHDVEKFNVN